MDNVPYYYFPDYRSYYAATTGQYYYPSNGEYISNLTPPSNIDLNRSYVVLLDRNANKPWLNHEYYERNYPARAEEQYGNIVRDRHLIDGMSDNHMVVPRAYDENTNNVLLEERTEGDLEHQRGRRVAVHEVPMGTISPGMPATARQYRYGGDQRGR